MTTGSLFLGIDSSEEIDSTVESIPRQESIPPRRKSFPAFKTEITGVKWTTLVHT